MKTKIQVLFTQFIDNDNYKTKPSAFAVCFLEKIWNEDKIIVNLRVSRFCRLN